MTRRLFATAPLSVEPLEDRCLLSGGGIPIRGPLNGEPPQSVRLVAELDLDGDGNNEKIYVDPNKSPGEYTTDEDADDPDQWPNQDKDEDIDIVVLGGKGSNLEYCGHIQTIDKDKKDWEVLLNDSELYEGLTRRIDVDQDGDVDIIILGTKK